MKKPRLRNQAKITMPMPTIVIVLRKAGLQRRPSTSTSSHTALSCPSCSM